MKPHKKLQKIKTRKKEKAQPKSAPRAVKKNDKPLFKIAASIRSKILNKKEVESKLRTPKTKKVPLKKETAQVEIGPNPEFELKKTKIKIIGIGGGGGNIVSEIAQRIKKSSFAIANTDFQALRHAPKNVSTFQFGQNLTHGLGTGMDPRIAEEAASVEREKIKKIVEGQDLVIIVSSLGGGTGSGAAPIFAQVTKSMGILTYGIFTLPFAFEGAKKNDIAKESMEKVRPFLNAVTILPNERVFQVVPKTTPFTKTLSHINTSLSDALEGLIETIYDVGLINIDFADLRAILTGNGKTAFLSSAKFNKGQEANLESFELVFSSPLYPYGIDKARGLLLNIVAQKDLKLVEVNKILTGIANRIHKDAKIIFGVSQENAVPDEVKVTVLATGCSFGGEESDSNGAANGEERAVPVAQNQKDTKKTVTKKKTTAAKTAKPKIKQKKKGAKKIAVKKEAAAAPIKQSKEETIEITHKDPDKIIQKPVKKEEADSGDLYQAGQSIIEQFEPPVRKNALQVKKEVEREEREILDKEKAWEIPAFLRKKKK